MTHQPVDYKTMSTFRGILREKNEKWCPDKAARLQTQIQTHFIERLFERFTTTKEQGQVLVDTMNWIRDNYAMLQRENTWGRRIQHRIHCTKGTSVIILFDGCITLRTCWLYEPNGNEE